MEFLHKLTSMHPFQGCWFSTHVVGGEEEAGRHSSWGQFQTLVPPSTVSSFAKVWHKTWSFRSSGARRDWQSDFQLSGSKLMRPPFAIRAMADWQSGKWQTNDASTFIFLFSSHLCFYQLRLKRCTFFLNFGPIPASFVYYFTVKLFTTMIYKLGIQ